MGWFVLNGKCSESHSQKSQNSPVSLFAVGFCLKSPSSKVGFLKESLEFRSYMTVSMRWHQWDQTTWIKLILNDGRHKVCAHMHNTHFRTWSNINKLHRKPPEIVSHLLSLRVEKSHKFWQAWKTLYLQILYLKDLVENVAQFFFPHLKIAGTDRLLCRLLYKLTQFSAATQPRTVNQHQLTMTTTTEQQIWASPRNRAH